MRRLIWRISRAGCAAAVAVWIAGWAFEQVRFGDSDAAAVARVEAELRQRFDASAERLGTMAATVAAATDVIRAAPRDPAALRRLFDSVSAVVPAGDIGTTGITVYGAGAAPLAWAGSVSELQRERIAGAAGLFVAGGALGPRLMRVEPVADPAAPRFQRLATIVVEQLIGRTPGAALPGAGFVVPTSLVPVTIRARLEGQPPADTTFVIPSRGGGPLVDATIAPGDIEAARSRLRRLTQAAVLSVLGITLLLCAGPLVEWRRRTSSRGGFAAATAALSATLVSARLVFWFAAGRVIGPRPGTAPPDLLLSALLLAALVAIAFDALARGRTAGRRPRVLAGGPPDVARVAVAFGIAGALGAAMLGIYETFLRGLVLQANLDVLHFSLHPISAPRLAISFALVLLHATVIWAAALLVPAASLIARTPRHGTLRPMAAVAWIAAATSVAFAFRSRIPSLPLGPVVVAITAAAVCGIAASRLDNRSRGGSQAARLGKLLLALIVPALAMYPSVSADALAAKDRLVADQFAVLAVHHRDELESRLRQALEQIDAQPSLDELVRRPATSAIGPADRAFLVWSRTDLATFRLTSAVELYGGNGQLVSRFSLNLPEYAPDRHEPARCEWDLFGEVSPFGSSERHVIDASRAICSDTGRIVGSILVRVMLDYRMLPFSSPQSPYLESLHPDQQQPAEGAPGRDVEFVLYGWSRAPLYASGTSVWPLPDRVFERMAASRAPLWTTLERDNDEYRVYFVNDRSGIYALGYPQITAFGELVNLAELMTLAGVLYVLLLAGATVFNVLTSGREASGRALLTEIRASFYRKLFFAFVLAAVVPVVILAIATRAYFANQFRAGIEDAAARTALVAQRLVEDYATLQQRGTGTFAALDDQIMVLVGRAIDQDVNLFESARLQATSERDLFASQILSTRTPATVYRSIVLDRLPTFVGVEQTADLPYLMAAAPVRAGDREGIVTVPVTLRQQEIEQQIDDLDRRVLFAAVLFVLFGAGLGYWMAERIADPVNRLTRATRRITRGDLDAHAAASSADELGRLVNDFNDMARELKRQRAELERTQRLEAWADMARQVAHDIKNPLTPIQLSAEHARRVNLDRGAPLSPVLDECVSAILSQVRLLRQIAAEFSSFASAPTPRPAVTELGPLLEEVIAPYRTALADRVALSVVTAADLPRVNVDPTLLARALTNVVENALHAMPGGGALSVAARVDRAAAQVLIEVTDTGVGMGPEDIERIFEPYFSTRATGSGLGLTIAKRNVELNGGTIMVESARGTGTKVVIALPV